MAEGSKRAMADGSRSPARLAEGSRSPRPIAEAARSRSPAPITEAHQALVGQPQRGTPVRHRVKGPDEWPQAPGTPGNTVVRASPTPPNVLVRLGSRTPPRLATGRSPTPPRPAASLTPPRLRASQTPPRLAPGRSPGSPPRPGGVGKDIDAPLGFIERLSIENFKSYCGLHEIGPFEKFSCVIGPNGSGKSNVMDAISFCLGIRAKHLRGDRLKDLVYRREEESVDNNERSARVTIHFRSGRGELLAFERVIRAGGESAYRYGTSSQKIKGVTYDEFLKLLADQQIFVKARNFLVFQGDVMDMARKQGLDLSGVLETISGSEKLKEEYESLQTELEITQEKARMHFQHLTEIRQNVMQLQKQREVVEKYQALSTERASTLCEMNLFKLFSYYMEAEKSRNEHREAAAQVADLEKSGKTLAKEITEIDSMHKTVHKDMEKAWNAKLIYSSNAEYQKPSLHNCMKTIEHYSKKRQQVLTQIEDQSKDQTASEAKLGELKAQRNRVQTKILELKGRIVPTVKLTQKQRQLYDEACSTAEASNIRAHEQRREADEQLRRLRLEAQVDAQDLRHLESRGDHGERSIHAIVVERAELDKHILSFKEEQQEQEGLLKKLKTELQRNQDFRHSLKEEERKNIFQLDLYRTKRERLEKADAKIRLADELRAAFPGSVIGRVSELVVPSQKRFELALQTALDGKADAFVVTDHTAGAKCIAYLKAKRVRPEVFLPLDRLKVRQDAGALHSLTQGRQARRLASVCILPNEKFLERNPSFQDNGSAIIDRVMSSLLGGTVIVDDLMEARSVAYTDAVKRKLTIKTVSLNGEVIQSNGNMELKSQSSMGLVEFGGSDELDKMRQVEKKLQDGQQDIRNIEERIAAARTEEAHKAMQIDGFKIRLKELQDQLAMLQDVETTEQKGQEVKENRLKELQAKAKRHENAERRMMVNRDAAEAELLQRGKKFFAALSTELGVKDVQELLLQEEAGKKRRQQELEEQEDRLRECEAREQGLSERLKESQAVTNLRLDLEGFVQKTKEEENRHAELKARIETFERNHLEEEKRHKRLKEQTEELAAKLSSIKAELQGLKEKREIAVAKSKATNEKAHRVLSHSCHVLRDCREQNVEIPFRTMDQTQFDLITSRAYDIDEKTLEELSLAFNMVRVDFTTLPKEKAVEFSKKLETMLAHELARSVDLEYQERLEAMKRELDMLNPNMSAREEHQLEAEKLEDIKRQGDEAASKVADLEARFEATKAQRTARFMKCFRHVEAVVQPFYKELTSYDGYEGGSAYLDLDDAEEPYNGGITFTACPPGKRFFPMELLSGGEKSMASMALLFSMHSYRPPPFMILDEVDAPFDKKNTDSLVRYLEKLKFQCLVISLKDTFFRNSDALVGIFKDKVAQSSGVITLPLSRLGDESQDARTRGSLQDAD